MINEVPPVCYCNAGPPRLGHPNDYPMSRDENAHYYDEQYCGAGATREGQFINVPSNAQLPEPPFPYNKRTRPGSTHVHEWRSERSSRTLTSTVEETEQVCRPCGATRTIATDFMTGRILSESTHVPYRSEFLNMKTGRRRGGGVEDTFSDADGIAGYDRKYKIITTNSGERVPLARLIMANPSLMGSTEEIHNRLSSEYDFVDSQVPFVPTLPFTPMPMSAQVDQTAQAIRDLGHKMVYGNLTVQDVVREFNGLDLGVQVSVEDAVKRIIEEVVYSDDPFTKGGQLMSTITKAIGDAISKSEEAASEE